MGYQLWVPEDVEQTPIYRDMVVDSNDPRWVALRAPFPPNQVGKLPRVWCRNCSQAAGASAATKHCSDHQIQSCRVCGNRLTTAHLHLDYVGHAAVTSRLLAVDPHWDWRPVTAEEAERLPKVEDGLWIALTVLGVTRYGVGDASGGDGSRRSAADIVKIQIGDALRNAAMRFGVALDLWSKEDLLANDQAKAEREDEVQRGLTEDTPPASSGREWGKEAAAIDDLETLTQLARECNDAGEFKGAAKAALATRRRKLENDAKSAEAAKKAAAAPETSEATVASAQPEGA